MPLTIPTLDDRRYQDLLDEALARIPVHNPEWTNFNKSDPGVTMIELFAFLTENLLYRANQIPERNRRKFLTLLGVPLQPAASARGIVTFSNERGPLTTVTLSDGVEVRAGQTPFRTEKGLDVLPIEAQVYFKRQLLETTATPKLKAYYKQLYASFMGQPAQAEPLLYEIVPLTVQGTSGIDLATTVDNAVWIALLVRETDKPYDQTLTAVREAIGGKTLNLGVAPLISETGQQLAPGGEVRPQGVSLLQYEMPKIPADGALPSTRLPQYQSLGGDSEADVLRQPGIVQLTLPPAPELRLWNNLDPLESGVDQFPPALEDTALNDRLITWIRIRSTAAIQPKFLWLGINAVFAAQRARVVNEILPNGTGEPDQVVVLAKKPVIPGSVTLRVTINIETVPWAVIDDLTAAGPEVPAPDLRQPPGRPPVVNPQVNVFMLNPEAGEIRFGDGAHGRRPPFGAQLRADYDYGEGPVGNVGVGAINNSPTLPAGFKVTNPLRTWGGAEAESESEGEKQITRYLQHRDRLVNAADFETITLRTPGVDIGRVEVLSAFNPALKSPTFTNEPGDAPGAVTLMVIPKYDTVQPDAPQPDQLFLNAICTYLEQRRLVTTELFLRGPEYKQIWVSVGMDVVAGYSVAQVREAVKQALQRFLSPLPPPQTAPSLTSELSLTTPQYAQTQKGWPLRKPVVDMELLAEASRVPGVAYVSKVLLAEGTASPSSPIRMDGLNLPRLMRIEVAVGEPVPLEQLRGQTTTGTTPPAGSSFVSVPVIPEQCR